LCLASQPGFHARSCCYLTVNLDLKQAANRKLNCATLWLARRYSGSDLSALCREAAMVPLRELGSAVAHVSADRVRPVGLDDFSTALESTKPSVSRQQLGAFDEWTKDFGSV